jgi:hypothetical protein
VGTKPPGQRSQDRSRAKPNRAGGPLSAVPFDHAVLRFARKLAGNRLGSRAHSVSTSVFSTLVGIVIFAVIICSDALCQQSLQELESMSQFEHALAAVDAIRNRKQLECVLSIAERALCKCLSQKLPLNTNFRNYASSVAQEKESEEYGKLSVADKKIVDQCVSDSR